MSEPKVSRMVADRVAITNTVVSAIRVHGPEVASIVEKALFPNGVPNNLTMGMIIDALGTHLEKDLHVLVESDRAHATELADDDGPRQIRDERIVDVKEFLSSLRSNLIRNYGVVVAGAYGLSAAIPEDASALLLLADTVEHLLRTRALVEAPKNKSLKVDALLAADELKSTATALRSAVGDVEREKREAQLTLGAKNDAMVAWGNAYPAIADAAAAFFVLAGRTDLAQRVRPTARRRAGLPEDETTTEAPAPAVPAGGNVPSGQP